MNIDLYILAFSAVTVLVTIWMGFRSAKKSKTASDFFVAGRSVGVGMNASAISGEYLSAASFMGIAGMVMSSGYDALWYPVCYACGYLFLLLFIAGPLRRFGAYTIPDFAEGRFDSPVFRKIAVVFVLFIGFFYTMPQMKGAGTTLAYIFPGLPYWAGVVLVGAVITLNVALGGMKGITLVQAFQYWAKMFAISVPIFVLMAVYGHYGKQVGRNGLPPPTPRISSLEETWINSFQGQTNLTFSSAKELRDAARAWNASSGNKRTIFITGMSNGRLPVSNVVRRLSSLRSDQLTVNELRSAYAHATGREILYVQPSNDLLPLSFDTVDLSEDNFLRRVEEAFRRGNFDIHSLNPTQSFFFHQGQFDKVSALIATKHVLSTTTNVPTVFGRQPLPPKAPADATWLNPFGPLTTKAAKNAAAAIGKKAAASAQFENYFEKFALNLKTTSRAEDVAKIWQMEREAGAGTKDSAAATLDEARGFVTSGMRTMSFLQTVGTYNAATQHPIYWLRDLTNSWSHEPRPFPGFRLRLAKLDYIALLETFLKTNGVGVVQAKEGAILVPVQEIKNFQQAYALGGLGGLLAAVKLGEKTIVFDDRTIVASLQWTEVDASESAFNDRDMPLWDRITKKISPKRSLTPFPNQVATVRWVAANCALFSGDRYFVSAELTNWSGGSGVHVGHSTNVSPAEYVALAHGSFTNPGIITHVLTNGRPLIINNEYSVWETNPLVIIHEPGVVRITTQAAIGKKVLRNGTTLRGQFDLAKAATLYTVHTNNLDGSLDFSDQALSVAIKTGLFPVNPATFNSVTVTDAARMYGRLRLGTTTPYTICVARNVESNRLNLSASSRMRVSSYLDLVRTVLRTNGLTLVEDQRDLFRIFPTAQAAQFNAPEFFTGTMVVASEETSGIHSATTTPSVEFLMVYENAATNSPPPLWKPFVRNLLGHKNAAQLGIVVLDSVQMNPGRDNRHPVAGVLHFYGTLSHKSVFCDELMVNSMVPFPTNRLVGDQFLRTARSVLETNFLVVVSESESEIYFATTNYDGFVDAQVASAIEELRRTGRVAVRGTIHGGLIGDTMARTPNRKSPVVDSMPLRAGLLPEQHMSANLDSLTVAQALGIYAVLTGRQLLPNTNSFPARMDDLLGGQLSALKLVSRPPAPDSSVREHGDGAFTAGEVKSAIERQLLTNGIVLVPAGKSGFRMASSRNQGAAAELRGVTTGGDSMSAEKAWLAKHEKPLALLYTYSLIIAIVCGTAGLPHILVRFYTNPDGVAAKRTTMWVMILIGVFYVFPPVFGVIGRNLLPELYNGVGAKGTDKIVLELPRILNEKYPPLGSILSGITCAGAFAAFMSTFSGLLVSMTGALAHDVYGRILRPKATAEQRMRMFKIGAVLLGSVAVLLGSFVEPLEINFMVGQAFAIAAASYFPLLFMAVWWRRLTMKGAAVGMLSGGVCALVAAALTNFSNLALDKGPMGKIFAAFAPLNGYWAVHPLLRTLCEQPAIWAVPLAITLMVIVSKLTARTVPEDIRMKMLVLHAPEQLGLKQEYIQEHQPGH